MIRLLSFEVLRKHSAFHSDAVLTTKNENSNIKDVALKMAIHKRLFATGV
jgi:hypothetical protein